MSLFPEPLPGSDFIHAHCDGGSRGNPGPSGYGAVVTDERGRMLAELSDFLGIRTNNFAEYSGLLAVLEWALANGHRRVKVVSDSLLMVQQIKGKFKVNSPDLKPLWQEARNRIAKLESFEISHALRHKNKEADALANAAMDRGMKRGGGLAESKPAATPYPTKAAAPPDPYALNRIAMAAAGGTVSTPAKPPSTPSGTMHRGYTRDGVVHLLGGVTLPDGIFVKVLTE